MRRKPIAPRFAFAASLALFAFVSDCTRSPQVDELTPTPRPTAQATAHETSEGLPLGSDNTESVYAGARCPANAKVRAFDIVAINVEMTLNRYLDYDPQGRMYVLAEDLNRVRQEEAQSRDARADRAEPAVSIGLQGDAIQPLSLRVNQGECLRITLTNQQKDGEPASVHLHGSSLHMQKSGAPAIATNPDSIVGAGASASYEWMVSEDEPEGPHYLHSHGDDRNRTNHGLFGALIVEPKGSEHLDPLRGGALRSGWSAIIKPPNSLSAAMVTQNLPRCKFMWRIMPLNPAKPGPPCQSNNFCAPYAIITIPTMRSSNPTFILCTSSAIPSMTTCICIIQFSKMDFTMYKGADATAT